MPEGAKHDDCDDASVEAARSAILELMNVLGEYREEIVLVGGWVPFLSLDAPEDPLDRHPGSGDVDIVLNHQELEEAGYETIAKRLEDAGYQLSGEQPFQYEKTLTERLRRQGGGRCRSGPPASSLPSQRQR